MSINTSREEFLAEAANFSDYLDYPKAIIIGFPKFKKRNYFVGTDAEEKQLSNFLSGFLVESVYVGGLFGGSCWVENPDHYYSSSGKKIEFLVLDNFLSKVAPNTPLIQYREIKNSLVKEEDYTEREYYGNTSDYKIFWVNLNDLYDYLA